MSAWLVAKTAGGKTSAVEARPHPAKFSKPILTCMALAIDAWFPHFNRPQEEPFKLLDPFAGVGGCHQLALPRLETIGVEIEPEWAFQHPHTWVGDARKLLLDTDSFDVVATSPCYGNRMADHHEAKDKSERNTYRHKLGRPLSSGNSGQLYWGERYKTFHQDAWAEAKRVLRPDNGLLLVNISDHIKGGERQYVSEWHKTTLELMGFEHVRTYDIATQRNGYGANGKVRVDYEHVMVFLNQ